MAPISYQDHQDSYQPNQARAKAVTVLVGIGMMLDLIGVGVGWSQASLLSGMAAGQSYTNEEIQANDARVQLVAALSVLVYLSTVVIFLMWIHRAHKNLAFFRAAGLEYSPGWAVGWFFIPFLNLIRPFLVMREIWKASDPNVDYQNSSSWQYSASSPLIGAWWGSWILANVLGRLVSTFSKDASTIDSLLNLTYLTIATDMTNLIPSVLVIVLITAIGRRQQQKHQRLMLLWAQVAAQVAEPVPSLLTQDLGD